MTTQLSPAFINDSILFKAATYDTDGVTLITPASCVCSVFNRATGAAVITSAAGTVGSGYAQYNWAGSAAAGVFDAVLTVTLSSGVVVSEEFAVEVQAKPSADFSYDISTDIGKVRFEIGDDTLGDGVRPDGRNFTDAELSALITREGSWGAGAAAALEIAARQWARMFNTSYGGGSESPENVATRLKEQAQQLRALYGGGGGSLSAGVIALDFMQKDDTSTT